MNLLASLLPGLREVRTPLAVGAMWFATAWLYLAPDWDRATTTNTGVAGFVDAFDRLPHAYAVGALSFAVYVSGCATAGLGTAVRRRLEQRAYAVLNFLTSRKAWQRFARVHRVVTRAKNTRRRAAAPTDRLLTNVVAEQLARAGAPYLVPEVYPVEAIGAQLDVAAYQLWKEAPAQYEEYDRLRAEAEFRSGMALPILALAILVTTRVSWPALPVGVVVAATMWWQGFHLEHRSREVLASAAFNDLIKIPVLDSLVQDLKTLGLDGKREETWIAASVSVLWRRGASDAAEEMLGQSLEFYDEEDIGEYVRQHAPFAWGAVTGEYEFD